MSAEHVDAESGDSSTEYWPGSGSSVAGTLSPASELSEEVEWEGLNPSIENVLNDTVPPQEEANVDLNAEFMGYLERFLLCNLFSLSPATLWWVYTQLILYYNMVATVPDTQFVIEIPAVEGDVSETSEGEIEPPILTREQ